MARYTALAGTLLLLLGISGCYPSDSLTTSELDVISTEFDRAYFENNSPMTYYLPDSIGTIGSEDDVDEPPVSEPTQDFILDKIETELGALGYTRINTLPDTPNAPDSLLPDVVVFASAIVIRTNVSGCIPWYPGWGWNPWYPGWGWGPGYCYPSYLYSYDTGTLAIDMISPDDSTDEELARVWHVAINGLLRSSESASRAALDNNISQAFDQSPYLAP